MSEGDDLRARVAVADAPPVKHKRTREPYIGHEVELNRLRRKVAELEARLEALEVAFGGGFNVP